MNAALFLNRKADKNHYDSITIIKRDGGYDGYKVIYKNDLGLDGETVQKNPITSIFRTQQELFDYIELSLDLIMEDKDKIPYLGIDLIIPGLPITCLKPDETSKKLILKSFKFWTLS